MPVVVRTLDELTGAVANNPFARKDPKHLALGFLKDKPSPSRVKTLDPDRSPGDAFHVRGKEIYFHLPNGAARSKLTTQYIDSRLATTCTVRNWRTVSKLIELAAG